MTNKLAVKVSLALIALILLVLIGLYVALYPIFTSGLSTASVGITAERMRAYDQTLFFAAGIGALFVAAGFSLIFGQRIARPLIEMEKATSSIVEGQFNSQVNIRGNDELAKLGAGINRLAKHLSYLEDTRKAFLSHIAHELRTPLSYIRGYSQALSEGLIQDESDKSAYLIIIHEESVRLSQLIEDLFSLAQSDAGEMRVQTEPISADELVMSVLSHLQPKALEKGIQIKTNLNATGIFQLDPMRMKQVILNLLDNAIRYVDEHGKITIETSTTPNYLQIAVQNSGDPIPPEDLPHIFERLYRVEKSRTRQAGGTGLGLAIVKHIVELHGGTIAATSSPDWGTRFVIMLPHHSGEETRNFHA